MRIVAEVAGQDVASSVCERAKLELQGVRVTVGARMQITREMVERAAPGRPTEAARRLGISRTSAYRAIKDIR